MTTSFSGEGGIRTHAPFRTNGFQDRLVMTTSIPLHSTPFIQRFSIYAAWIIMYSHHSVRRGLFYHISKMHVKTFFSKIRLRFQDPLVL